jgi:hypothetical protein
MFRSNKFCSGLAFIFLQVFYCTYSMAVSAATITEGVAQCGEIANKADAAKTFAKGATEASPSFAKNVTTILKDKCADAFQVAKEVGVAAQALSLLIDAKNVACAAKSYIAPSNTEATLALNTDEECALLEAKKALEESLIEHVYDKLGSYYIPVACEGAARTFALVAGEKELEKIIIVFNKIRRLYGIDFPESFDQSYQQNFLHSAF